jgi:V/A-type H+-transporting ATPase subunit A
MTESAREAEQGYITEIVGSLVKIKGLETIVHLHDLIKISDYKILGEVIQIYSDHIVAQCFEDTKNLRLNGGVISLNEPLSMELGPGLLSNVFDGIQRPLEKVFQKFTSGGLERGVEIEPLSRTKKWHFIPIRKIDDDITGGDIIGTVQETQSLEHKIMAPPSALGKISKIAPEGDYTIIEEIYTLSTNGRENSFSMLQKWPVTKSRPFGKKKNPEKPLITGIRVIDLLFPIARGGTIAIPGGFGTGKTVIQQSLAKFCDADIIVYICCGEPGSEVASILKQFTEIKDRKSGQPLMDHIVVIANTSNMPVSAREASLFSGVTIAEYYRDMGYDVTVLADSTSRWAESLREISGLLEEMPAEEGYPAYLPSRLSSFYERAGVVEPLGSDNLGNARIGSLTIVGSISPPAGDFSEPVTSTTKRVVQVFWALDSTLAYLKHYPAISWLNSYSNYPGSLKDWWSERDIEWSEIDIDWSECRKQVNEILSQEQDLKYITQLLGEKNLPDDQQLILFIARIIKNGLVVQSAFDEIDNFTDPKKLLGLVKLILLLFNEGKKLINSGKQIEDILGPDIITGILRLSRTVRNENFEQIEAMKNLLTQRLKLHK